MKDAKRKRLEAAGWRLGSAARFLGLTPGEQAYVELRVNLATALAAKRKAKGLTQKTLAVRLKSSQSLMDPQELDPPQDQTAGKPPAPEARQEPPEVPAKQELRQDGRRP
jgi:hypothetical protein